MAGYTPVFDSVFQGSLCGRYPDLPVWLVLLAMAQRGGIIDAHPSYIATVSGLPQADIEEAIGRFCGPDPLSRTPDHDGRRLEPLPDRGFGWRVLNHESYRRKAARKDYDDARTASGEDAARKAVQRSQSRPVPTCPELSRTVPPSEAEAEAYNPSSLRSEGARGRAREADGEREPKRKAARIPDDFDPGEAGRAYAAEHLPNVDVEAFIEEFRDYWRACATPSAKKLDWQAAFRNRVRNCERYPMLRPAPLPTAAKVVRYDTRGNVIHD